MNNSGLETITDEKAIKAIKKLAKTRNWEINQENRLNFAIDANGFIIQHIEYDTPIKLVSFWRLRVKDFDGKFNKIEGSYKDIALKFMELWNKYCKEVIYL